MSKLSIISQENPILLIGCGKMGGAMLSGWLEQGLDEVALFIVDPNLTVIRSEFPQFGKKQLHETIGTLPKKMTPSVIVMAVKPQMMDQALNDLKPWDVERSVILSVAAGKTFFSFADHLGKEQAIIRAMPNTPAAIGRGITVCCSNGPVDQSQKDICTTLLETVGVVEWIDDETLMDSVTALSGSGPAYVFYLVETMAAAGESIGLPPKLSMKLARQTVSGAGALLDASDVSASKLRENVTSPGGTTAAALDVLMSDEGLAKIMRRAMIEAKNRSKELAS